MHSHSVEDFRHSHVFLGYAHGRNERKTWIVIAICAAMMVAEIVGGLWFGSVALVADGLHMSTHAGALLIAAVAYTYSRRHARDVRFAFGTGKLGDLAAVRTPFTRFNCFSTPRKSSTDNMPPTSRTAFFMLRHLPVSDFSSMKIVPATWKPAST